MRILWCKFRLWLYLVPRALFTGEHAAVGYVAHKIHLVAAGRKVGPGRMMLTRVFYSRTGKHHEGYIFDLWLDGGK